MHVSTSDGDTIDTTTNHPFYVEDKGWVAAGNLEIGDILVTADGDEVEVADIEIEKLAEPILVYNLEVEDFHTYFVGEYGVLVHNTCFGNWGDGGKGSPENNQIWHYDKHGSEVKAFNLEQYLDKAKNFANTVLNKKIKGVPISGITENVFRYRFNGKYIDLVFENGEHLIISFGVNVIKY